MRLNLPVLELKVDEVTTHLCLSLDATRYNETSSKFTDYIDT